MIDTIKVVKLTTFISQDNYMQTITPIRSKKISPISIKLNADEKDQLTEIAKYKTRSVHSVVCEAVREYMERERARLDFAQEARNAWEHSQQTGLHVTQDEVDAWLETLYTDNEIHLVCHK